MVTRAKVPKLAADPDSALAMIRNAQAVAWLLDHVWVTKTAGRCDEDTATQLSDEIRVELTYLAIGALQKDLAWARRYLEGGGC